MIVDFRARPPSPEFNAFFNPEFTARVSRRAGASHLPQAFVEGSVDRFFAEMDAAGVDVSVVLGRNSPAVAAGATTLPAGIIPNAHIADLQAAHPGRVVGFAGIDVSNGIHDALAEIEKWVVNGPLHGIFIEPQRALASAPDDPRIDPVYDLCQDHGIPVNIMTGPLTGGHVGFADPAPIDVVAGRYPRMPIVCGHGCWPYVDDMIAVAYKHESVFVSPDCYVFMPGAAERYVGAANGFMADQFLFGTAYPIYSFEEGVERFRRLPFTPEALDKAFGLNAKRLLGL
jgi:predicted TIM-barrel fold metal-dependent hydrolase